MAAAPPDTTYEYQIGCIELDNDERLVRFKSFVFHLNFTHTRTLIDHQETRIPHDPLVSATYQEELVVPCHEFFSLPNVMAREMIFRMGVVSPDTAAYLASQLAAFAAEMAKELAGSMTIDVFLDINAVTPYDDQEEMDRALRESAEIRAVTATKSSIEALKEVNIESILGVQDRQHQCSICLEEFSFDHNIGDDRAQKLAKMPCSHVYHKNCIEEWLKTSHMCPLCRYAMPTIDRP
ncbi:43kDa postsynaptic protein [Trema orientale]|uniref:RING-type E3 ubiquitin transferase n=1 Tax=Trema orientale TaxID=63057 RepID=A0A2P5EHN8_TREOI|nr:43kDa postsynaptic protein [Trema orientale]